MSEELKIDDVVDAVKTATEGFAKAEALAEKADKADIPSVDGFLKAEDLDELKSANEELKSKVEEMSATIAAAPAVNKGVEMDDGFFKWDGELSLDGRGGVHNKTSIDLTKADTNTTNITGAPTASQRVFFGMLQMNPFRGYSTIMPTSATAVNLPQVSNITAQAETAVPDSINLGTVPPHGGALSSAPVIPQNWVSRTAFTDQAVADLPSLDMMVGAFQAQQIAVAEAVDMVAQLDGNSNVTEVNTGAAAGLPADIGPWTDLMASLSSAYLPGAMWWMSRQAYAHLRSTTQGGSGSDLLFDPASGKNLFLGYPVMINDHLDAGTVAGQNPVYFGDFRAGTVIVSRKEMSISRHEDTIPGALYYYGNLRSRGVVWDPNALARFNVGA